MNSHKGRSVMVSQKRAKNIVGRRLEKNFIIMRINPKIIN